jgi:hypothetical protein
MWIGVLVLRDMHLILIHLFSSFPKKKKKKPNQVCPTLAFAIYILKCFNAKEEL